MSLSSSSVPTLQAGGLSLSLLSSPLFQQLLSRAGHGVSSVLSTPSGTMSLARRAVFSIPRAWRIFSSPVACAYPSSRRISLTSCRRLWGFLQHTPSPAGRYLAKASVLEPARLAPRRELVSAFQLRSLPCQGRGIQSTQDHSRMRQSCCPPSFSLPPGGEDGELIQDLSGT